MSLLPLVPPFVPALSFVFPRFRVGIADIPPVFDQAFMEQCGRGAAFDELNAFAEVAG